MNKYSTVFLALFLLMTLSCSSDDDSPGQVIPDGDFANGTLILNEGTSAGGSVSFLSQDLQEIDNSIFEDVNAGEGLGLFLQSIFFDDDKAFIISNGSNIITVVNRYTFELIGTIDSDLSVPRYGTVHNGKAEPKGALHHITPSSHGLEHMAGFVFPRGTGRACRHIYTGRFQFSQQHFTLQAGKGYIQNVRGSLWIVGRVDHHIFEGIRDFLP